MNRKFTDLVGVEFNWREGHFNDDERLLCENLNNKSWTLLLATNTGTAPCMIAVSLLLRCQTKIKGFVGMIHENPEATLIIAHHTPHSKNVRMFKEYIQNTRFQSL